MINILLNISGVILLSSFLIVGSNNKSSISKYFQGQGVWIDRGYRDTVRDSRLDELFILQISRHRTDSIIIVSETPINIYRFKTDDSYTFSGNVTLKNENSIFDDWTKTDIPIFIKGTSSIHRTVYVKQFNTDTIILPAGGPLTTAPILFEPIDTSYTGIPISILY
jgi:hypothetical protein